MDKYFQVPSKINYNRVAALSAAKPAHPVTDLPYDRLLRLQIGQVMQAIISERHGNLLNITSPYGDFLFQDVSDILNGKTEIKLELVSKHPWQFKLLTEQSSKSTTEQIDIIEVNIPKIVYGRLLTPAEEMLRSLDLMPLKLRELLKKEISKLKKNEENTEENIANTKPEEELIHLFHTVQLNFKLDHDAQLEKFAGPDIINFEVVNNSSPDSTIIRTEFGLIEVAIKLNEEIAKENHLFIDSITLEEKPPVNYPNNF